MSATHRRLMLEGQAFQELARGEQTATALENQLSAMEAKIEALLAQAEKDEQETQRMKAEKAGSSAGTNGDEKPALQDAGA